jgi:hypothetical protein
MQDGSFSWASPLGIAVALFLAYGAIYLLRRSTYRLT